MFDKNYYLNNISNARNNLSGTVVILNEQGYEINRNKAIRLNLMSMLYDCFSNIEIFDSDRINNLQEIYNRLILR